MEIDLFFELDLIWSKREKMKNYISKKFIQQLEKIYNSSKRDYFNDLYSFYRGRVRIIPRGERRVYSTFSKQLLLYTFTNFNGFILVSINGEEEKLFIDSLDRFLKIQEIIYQSIFETHPNKIEKFNRRKKVKIRGTKKREEKKIILLKIY